MKVRISTRAILCLIFLVIQFEGLFVLSFLLEEKRALVNQVFALDAELVVVRDEFRKHKEYRGREYFAESFVIHNCRVVGITGEKVFLKELLNGSTLLFYFSETCCLECVDNYLHILNELSKNVCYGKIIAISNYDKLNKLRIKINNLGINFPCYNTPDKITIPLDTSDPIHEKPYLFVVDSSLNVKFPKIGWPKDSISNAYFERVMEYLNL